MKHTLSLLALFALLITMTACAASEDTALPTTPDTSGTVPSDRAETLPSTTAETAPVESTVPETQSSGLPYTINIPRADFSIWGGPSYDDFFVDSVRVATLYTIVEEATDAEGNLWGRLKSGAGWVDLTLLAQESAQPPLVTVNFATTEQMTDEKNHFYNDGASDYAFTVYVYAPVTDMTFCPVYYNESLIYEEPLFSLENWSPEQPFVARAPFPGDMSMYAIRFTDSQGTAHTYLISISGRNGTFCITPEI